MKIITEKRERAEKSSDRIKAQNKKKKKGIIRAIFVTVGFLALAGSLVALGVIFSKHNDAIVVDSVEILPNPTIEIVDDDAYATGGKISTRMTEYIGLIEKDFRDFGYSPVKAVIPSGAIREIDFYFEDFGGRIKTTIDRDAAVMAEDMDRMVRYLTERGITQFEYIDVRVEGKAYWK